MKFPELGKSQPVHIIPTASYATKAIQILKKKKASTTRRVVLKYNFPV